MLVGTQDGGEQGPDATADVIYAAETREVVADRH